MLLHSLGVILMSFFGLAGDAEAPGSDGEFRWCVLSGEPMIDFVQHHGQPPALMRRISHEEYARLLRSVQPDNPAVATFLDQLAFDGFYPGQHPCVSFNQISAVEVNGETRVGIFYGRVLGNAYLDALECEDLQDGEGLRWVQAFSVVPTFGDETSFSAPFLQMFPNYLENGRAEEAKRLYLTAIPHDENDFEGCLPGFQFMPIEAFIEMIGEHGVPNRTDEELVWRLHGAPRQE